MIANIGGNNITPLGRSKLMPIFIIPFLVQVIFKAKSGGDACPSFSVFCFCFCKISIEVFRFSETNSAFSGPNNKLMLWFEEGRAS